MNNQLSSVETSELFAKLKARFEKNMGRHRNQSWEAVQKRLLDHPEKIATLQAMEISGGEPDVVDLEDKQGEITFVDCAPESPLGRRSTCYDQQALDDRKTMKPENSAMGMANAMGIELLTKDQYYKLQTFGHFDQKTSSWIMTPSIIRKLDGALFCDYRYDTVFTYHNGADSYYSSRGFRGLLRV